MNLTEEQHEALARGEEITVILDDIECVVMRREVREKIKNDLTEGEVTALARHAFDDADTAGPIE